MMRLGASGAAVSFAPKSIPQRGQGGVMTKSDFVDQVASSSGLSKKDAGSAVDAVLGTIENALKSGDEVSFTGFGKFHVAQRGAREGRNPRTGESMTIAASKVPRFTAGSGLKKAVK
ncbi:MAG TPA: HU family DNA-binding protein [Solirubrobacteraceae bacterium]|nr:HU family DNA-binding protein [Solirubrobacteraceae bacterium]